MKILMLVGSLRAGSWTRELVDTVPGLLPAGVEATAYDGLGDLPHYDQDLDGDAAPASVLAFREALRSADALVVATPEYNGSIPGVLKNAIDWASRPRGAAPIDGLPAAVLSVSPSPRGAQWAREDLVKVLRVAGAQPLEDALGVATVHEAVVDGAITDADVEAALRLLVGRLVAAGRERQAA
ncbi:NADPH-dependent FMN reductase [Marmoricola sp. Leaf446]|uniref:NADPH-dependent FMN reductase n=1 Tax=Marmoricola sp. Leaf446 TaxID=1736379 RepID=UPI0009E9C623|nr:NAD(P)H-dependent oxidoreductase [Marmoricola sp. Leaf446]